MHRILEESDAKHLLCDGDVVASLWAEFCEGNPFQRKGAKVSLNRWMSLVQEGRKELKLWSCRLAAYELVALRTTG